MVKTSVPDLQERWCLSTLCGSSARRQELLLATSCFKLTRLNTLVWLSPFPWDGIWWSVPHYTHCTFTLQETVQQSENYLKMKYISMCFRSRSLLSFSFILFIYFIFHFPAFWFSFCTLVLFVIQPKALNCPQGPFGSVQSYSFITASSKASLLSSSSPLLDCKCL